MMDNKMADSRWRSLYRIGGAAAWLCAAMYLITMAVYLPAYRAGPPPTTVLEWFTLFQTSPLTGLFFLGLADVVIMILWGPMSLALYTALHPSNKTWALIATTCIFVGMAVYLATNISFSMLSLSQQYAVAVTPADKSVLLAAGQTMLAVSQGTGGQYAGMPLAWLGGLILSVVMLQSKAFGKLPAWAGILGLVSLEVTIPFSSYTTGPAAGSALEAAVIAFTMIGGLLSLAWYILVGLDLWKLANHASQVLSHGSQTETSTAMSR